MTEYIEEFKLNNVQCKNLGNGLASIIIGLRDEIGEKQLNIIIEEFGAVLFNHYLTD